jgi:hypothetical protein
MAATAGEATTVAAGGGVVVGGEDASPPLSPMVNSRGGDAAAAELGGAEEPEGGGVDGSCAGGSGAGGGGRGALPVADEPLTGTDAMGASSTTSTLGQVGDSPVVCVRTVPGKGRGVFAGQDLPLGAMVEKAPCIAFPPEQYEKHLKVTRR